MGLLVAADDRSGAFEVAGLLAKRTHSPVRVVVWPEQPIGDIAVLDLGSRHLSPGEARDRAVATGGDCRHAHKFDSALRGNWADELTGRLATTPVLMVPALPHASRVCSGGVVYDHGRPVHEGSAGSDVRRRVTSSRPADMLRMAGADLIVEISDRGDVARWCDQPAGIAVVDAATDDEIASVVAAWNESAAGIVLAGTSAVVGRAAGDDAPDEAAEFRSRPGATLVVCGSVHPVARSQIAFAEHRGVPVTSIADEFAARQLGERGAMILQTEIPVGDVEEPLAVAAAASLARGVADLRSAVDIGAVVVIGGDTATAVFGGRSATVGGTLDEGTAWATIDDDPLPFITRSGGFGGEAALDLLIRAIRRP